MISLVFIAALSLACVTSFEVKRLWVRGNLQSKTSLFSSPSKIKTEFLQEAGNTTNPSTLYASEVSSFGISTALAEQHIQLGNFEDAKRLAEEAKLIGEHT